MNKQTEIYQEALIVNNRQYVKINDSWFEEISGDYFPVEESKITTMKEIAELPIIAGKSGQSILEEAHNLVYGQRQTDYGKAKDNVGTIASYWSVLFGIEISVEQVCQAMILLKIARLKTSPHHKDSWVDIAGYVGVKGKIDNDE